MLLGHFECFKQLVENSTIFFLFLKPSLREGFKNKLVEFSTKGGGGGEGQDQSIFH